MNPRDEEWLLKAFADLRAKDRPELPAGLVARILVDAENVQRARSTQKKRSSWRRWWQVCQARGADLIAIPSAAVAAGLAAIVALPFMQAPDSDLIDVAVLAAELEEAQELLGPYEMTWIAGWPEGIVDANGEVIF